MDQRYYFHDKTEILTEILKEDFNLSELEDEQVRYIITVLISVNSSDQIPREDLVAWFMDNSEEYAIPIGETPFSISFTDAGLDILKEIAVFYFDYITNNDPFFAGLLVSCGRSLIKSSYYVEDRNERCVYLQAVRWTKAHPHRVFTVQDLLEGLTKSNDCYNITIREDLSASLTEDEIRIILVKLAEVKVLNKYNDCFEFRI